MPSLSEQIEGFDLGHPDCVMAGRQADDPTLEAAKGMLPEDLRGDVVDAYVVFAIRTLNMPAAPGPTIELSIDQSGDLKVMNKLRVVAVAEYDMADVAGALGDEALAALQRGIGLAQAAINRGQVTT